MSDTREWIDKMRAADEAITEWALLHGWDRLRCETECGKCWNCGVNYAHGWIDALLSNPDLLDRAREKHDPARPRDGDYATSWLEDGVGSPEAPTS